MKQLINKFNEQFTAFQVLITFVVVMILALITF
jgi:hypothetical protein